MKKTVAIILALTTAFAGSSISFADDSYTEYFSEEREFVVGNNTYNDFVYL